MQLFKVSPLKFDEKNTLKASEPEQTNSVIKSETFPQKIVLRTRPINAECLIP